MKIKLFVIFKDSHQDRSSNPLKNYISYFENFYFQTKSKKSSSLLTLFSRPMLSPII